MDQSKLKKYAPQARLNFIAAVTERAAFYGLTSEGIEPVVSKGDVSIIGLEAFPRDVAVKRKQLEERIQRDGFQQTMEAMAYSWFNRFAAIRYMELHGYLDHGYRVLSHPEGSEQPEILEHAADLELSGLDLDKVVDLKLEGNKDEELYRLLLIAQCNALHKAMPFLFEEIGHATELLLPINLLHTDSLVRQLVESIDESSWDEIEVIGWLYQFYISEKKDQVIGKVVKSEDIPAATQLFTTNWIVKYMVQNSLGAHWLATYPDSKLKDQMEYYIEPAEQTEEVLAQLAAITPSQLNPEELTLMDPACGSGHILVEAYELFKAIYLERGYRQRDVPQLILEKNLFGLDIDERAAQLTGFALMMKGRADDRRLFEREVKLNVMALVESMDFDAERLAESLDLASYGLKLIDLIDLKELFEHAKTFGSLIQVPTGLASSLVALKKLSSETSQDLFVSDVLEIMVLLVRQAEVLSAQYNAVVANPPYMGRKGMNAITKEFQSTFYSEAQNDLYAAFMSRARSLLMSFGLAGFITRQDWMFTARNQPFREYLLDTCALRSLVHTGPNTFPELSGEIVQGAAVIFSGFPIPRIATTFVDVTVPQIEQKMRNFKAVSSRFTKKQEVFSRLPGRPLAYWIKAGTIDAFAQPAIESVSISDGQNKTADNERYIRQLWEVDCRKVGLDRKWLHYAKGGGFRKWAGNITNAVNWSSEARAHYRKSSRCRIIPEYLWYRPGVTWSRVASAGAPNGFRVLPAGSTFDMVGSSIFLRKDADIFTILGILNTGAASFLLRMLNPTVDLQVSDVRNIPYIVPTEKVGFDQRVSKLVELAKNDWDGSETAWDFRLFPLLTIRNSASLSLETVYTNWISRNRDTIAEMKVLEEKNNRVFIDAYGLQEEIIPDVPSEQITLTVNPAYRYGGKFTEEEQWICFREDTMEELVSYAIGCMMGRYSLDEPGLIYANSGNEGFDSSRYSSFPADDDGIIPLTDTEWFDDDAANRLVTFMSVAWDSVNLEENLKFLVNNLSPKKSESSRETIRRYLCDKFFKDHLQIYKNRPIYWLFSSGKQKAFQCLVYLHRYNEGTLARIRTEYVVTLQGMMASRVRQLDGDITAADSTVHRKRLEKERSTLVKQQTELQQFDEKLRHYADQRIPLDLDDGVKVNYGKFSSLLAEVKKVTGKNPD